MSTESTRTGTLGDQVVREIIAHRVGAFSLNDAVKIHAGPAGKGGASAKYEIALVTHRKEQPMIAEIERLMDAGFIVQILPDGQVEVVKLTRLEFQSKPIAGPEDFDGITNEALLAVMIDRLQGFQAGEFKCRENAIALTNLEEALMWLQKRTRERLARGVEGQAKA